MIDETALTHLDLSLLQLTFLFSMNISTKPCMLNNLTASTSLLKHTGTKKSIRICNSRTDVSTKLKYQLPVLNTMPACGADGHVLYKTKHVRLSSAGNLFIYL